MYRFILLFAFVTTALLTNASAEPAPTVEISSAPQAITVTEGQPETTDAASVNQATETAPAEPAAEAPAAPSESK